jgi:hypothetical protein
VFYSWIILEESTCIAVLDGRQVKRFVDELKSVSTLLSFEIQN